MRKVVESLLAASAVFAVAAAPAAADIELCITDPAVNVDGTVIQVGLYTHDESLIAAGGIPSSKPILVRILGSRDGDITTDRAAWTAQRPNVAVDVRNVLPGKDKDAKETVEIDALVPSALHQDSYYIKVTLANGTVKTSGAAVNHLARLRVQVPVQGSHD